jgi:hypothetical protein
MDSAGSAKIEGWFPNLQQGEYEITSPASLRYNCIAWAAGRADAWWEPVRGPGYFWPEHASWDDRVDSLVEVFLSLGFERCADGAVEVGFEKIAIYGEDGAYLHAARQMKDGRWASKLGAYEDIVHKTLDGLVGPAPAFGEILVILRRPLGK